MTKQRDFTKRASACALGALLAAMLLPTAAAHADQTDQDFTTFLQSHGVNLGSPGLTVKAAHVMCQDLDAGYTEKDEVDQLTGAHRLNPGQAQMFVAAATADYCPSHHPATKPTSSK
ncbi:DUF732 domain-containing protein [Mycobacterium sp. 852002-51057_SCH5723018]|uniref:DUF732 domain-containing protein n=1 Tax=Mycobacterium sp. 852002-51057_SCH5723018 TaxID=1834094 RepID=UPI0007FE6D94|nr:DUF732 domain-containing protein [Mycobacterium sp. 852002-51057_SCH5723018]OBG24583.1 hypothetical protein A5764_09240 [Mycobacterium sp. 852002-51057_SCH5723018]